MNKVTLIFLGILMIFHGMDFYQNIEFSAIKSNEIFFIDLNDLSSKGETPENEIPENGEAESEEENSENSDLKSRRIPELSFNLYFSYLDKQNKPHISKRSSVSSKIPTPPPEV